MYFICATAPWREILLMVGQYESAVHLFYR